MRLLIGFCLCALSPITFGQRTDIYLRLMTTAHARASLHESGVREAISDGNEAILSGQVPLRVLHNAGFLVIGGISDDPKQLRALVRSGIDGYITDRPDILSEVIKQQIAIEENPDEKHRLERFDVEAHRGGRGLRPENTLPSFENGLDLGVSTLEMDTGVSADNVSMVWHDEFFDPRMCRLADGSPYSGNERFWIHNKTRTELQTEFVCDQTPFAVTQKNDLSLSPVSVAFARQYRLLSPYSPVTLDQVFQFVRFYEDYYGSGAGKGSSHSEERVAEAKRVRFDIETKLIPNFLPDNTGKLQRTTNQTADPQAFVSALCPAIFRNRMQSRSEVQSFDFRTLKLVEEQFPSLPTYYLTSNPMLLRFQTAFLDSSRQTAAARSSHFER